MQTWTQTTYGAPGVLHRTHLDRPEPGPRQVLVQVAACAVTQGDRRVRAGDFPGFMVLPGKLMMGWTGPRQRPGSMIAGRVVAVGAEVTAFAVGDAVFGACMGGGMAEFVVMDEGGALAHVPAGWSLREAAALPYGGGTALHFLQDVARLQPGEHLAVIGAAGGVGRFAVQLGRHLGARVTAVCSAQDAALVRDLGADAVVDYHTADFRDAGPYDVVFDTVGASSFSACRGALSPSGRYATLVMTLTVLGQMLLNPLRPQKALTGVHLDDAEGLGRLVALAEAGAVRPVLAEPFAFADLHAAHVAVESGAVKGDVVVELPTPVAGGPRLVAAG